MRALVAAAIAASRVALIDALCSRLKPATASAALFVARAAAIAVRKVALAS